MYRITNYQDGYIDKQVEIGNTVISNWKYQKQSSKQLIEQIYKRDDFDPKTRLYAFKDNQMVGFLPAKIIEEEDKKIALYEFPIVLPEHEQKVAPMLIDKSLEVLQEKGVDEIRARVSTHWGKTERYAEEYGFSQTFDTLVTATISPEEHDMGSYQDHEEVIEMDYDNEQHLKRFSDSFVQRFPMRYEGEIEEWIDYYKGLNKAAQLLYFENEEVKGHLIGVLRDGQEESPVITAFYSQGEQQGEKMRKLLETFLSKVATNNYKKISIALGTEQIEYLDELEKLGIEFTSRVSRYSLDL